jgi:hypothetical protein
VHIADREVETSTTHVEREANTSGNKLPVHRPIELQFQGSASVLNTVVRLSRCAVCYLDKQEESTDNNPALASSDKLRLCPLRSAAFAVRSCQNFRCCAEFIGP